MLSILILLIAYAPAFAQQLKVLPEEGKLLGYVSSDQAGKWIVFGPNGFKPVQPTIIEGGQAVFWQGDPGEYAVIFFPPGEAQPVVSVVQLGGKIEPPPPPPPPPGDRWAIIFRETNDTNPDYGNLYVKLRTELTDLPIQIVDETNIPTELRKHHAHLKATDRRPVLLVLSSTDDLVRKVACPSSVDGVREAIEK